MSPPRFAIRARAAVQRRGVRTLFASPKLVRLLARARQRPIEGRTLDLHVAALLALDDRVGASGLSGKSAAVARAMLEEQVLTVDEASPANVKTRELRRARLYTPPNLRSPSAAVVYIHGGGFVTGSIESHDGLCRRLALQADVRVISLAYRLAPEHPFPAAVEDCVAGTRWVLSQAEQLQIDPARVAVAGDSAGGNLSAVVSHETRNDPLRPKLAVLLYPCTDATCSLGSHETMGKNHFLTSENIAWYLDNYAGSTDRRHPALSPLFAKDFSGLPRTLIYSAGFDPLRDEALAYAEALDEARTSVEYEELREQVHGFVMMGGVVPSARLVTERIFRRIGEELRTLRP
jgi:acetyl esterase